MEYKIKIELQDEAGRALAATTMTESQARAIHMVHEVDVLLDTVKLMKQAAEAKLKEPAIPEGIIYKSNGDPIDTDYLLGIQKASDRNSGRIYPVGGIREQDLSANAFFDNIDQSGIREIDLSFEKSEETTIGSFDDPSSSFLHNMQEGIDKRRGEAQEEFWPWVEDGIPVTKEDIQDYMTYFGTSSETAYERIKKYATGETKEIEGASTAKDITEKRTPLTPEQIAKLWSNPEK